MMKGHGTKLAKKQELAIVALLSERTHELAARRAGISETTLHRWLTLPEFRSEYRAARRRVVEGAIAKLQRTASDAVETLRDLLKCEHAPTRCRAAIAILELAERGVQLGDLAERVEELEQLAGRAPRGLPTIIESTSRAIEGPDDDTGAGPPERGDLGPAGGGPVQDPQLVWSPSRPVATGLAPRLF